MRVKRLWVALAVFIFSLATAGGLQAAVYLNDFPADINVNEGEPLIVPIFLEGTSLEGRPIELFVWVEDVQNPATKKYLSATGWVDFTDISTMEPLGAATMVKYINVQWRASETTAGMSDFYLNICMDGNVNDGILSADADCAEPRKVVIVKGGVQPPPPNTNCSLVVNPSSVTETVDWYGTKKVQIAVRDSCNNALDFNATTSATWMTLARQTGLLEVTLTGKNAGTYSGVISITAAGTTRQVPVTLTVRELCIIGNCGGSTTPPPCTPTSLSVWPAPVGLTAAAGETPSASVTVSNNCGSASYSATSATSWLSVSTSGTGTLTVTAVNTAGLSPNTYTGVVNISSGSLVRTLDVVLTISGVCEPTSAQIAPASVSQTITPGANAGASAITIQNNCQARIAYTVTAVDPMKDSTGMPVVPDVIATPTVNATGTGDLSVTFNSAHLGVGTYTGSITVTPSIGTPRTIPITITVTNVDPNIPTVVNGSFNYFDIPANGIRNFKYMSIPNGQGQPLQIHLAAMYQPGGNSDMIIKYAGPACENGLPTMSDYNLVKSYVASNGNSLWSASTGRWNPARAREDLYYNIGSLSFEFNEIYGVPDNPQGCYYIMVVNTLETPMNRLRLIVGDVDCNVLGNCPAAQEFNW